MGCKLDRAERNRRFAQLRSLRQGRDRWRAKAEHWKAQSGKNKRRMDFESDWALFTSSIIWVVCIEQDKEELNGETEHSREVLRHLKEQRALLRRTKRRLFKREKDLIARGELDREKEGMFDANGEFLEGLDEEQILVNTFRMVALQAQNERLEESTQKLISN